MPHSSNDRPVSALRRRMLEDMTMRGLREATQREYIRFVQSFAAFLGRSPDTASTDDIRRFQVHQAKTGMRPPTINGSVSVLRFLFTVTLDRPDLSRCLVLARYPRKLPTMLSVDEVARLLEAAPGPKYRAALGTAYGAGLRVSEVAALEVDAIVTWEPFESVPVIEGYGYFAKGLEYSKSESVGAELGMVVATKEVVDNKREAVERFVWAYLKAQETLAADPKAFAAAYADLTGLAPDVAAEAAKPITLGSVVTPEQIARQAKAFAELGVIQRDVSAEIEDYWDASLVKSAKGE